MLKNLSIILLHKDRIELTIPLLNYIYEELSMVNLVIADGDLESKIPENLQYAIPSNWIYFHKPDKSIKDFFYKIKTGIEISSGDYIALLDTDDFPVKSGLEECISFLEKNKDYISASCIIPGAKVKNNGKVKYRDRFSHGHYVNSFDDKDLKNRLSNIRNYQITFYDVYRKEVILEIFNKLIEKNISSYYALEYFFAVASILSGPQKRLYHSFHLIRRFGTSLTFDQVQPTFFEDLFTQPIIDDTNKIINLVKEDSAINNSSINEIRAFFQSFIRSRIIFAEIRSLASSFLRLPLLRTINIRNIFSTFISKQKLVSSIKSDKIRDDIRISLDKIEKTLLETYIES